MVCLLFFLAHGAWRTAHNAYANNISVSNPAITGQDGSSETAKVQFDISWENSWRNSVNYDAAWVFVKYSTDGGTTWAHATLKTSGTDPAGFSAGTGTILQIVVPTDKKGAFLQRSSSGSGSVDTDNIQFVWDWGSDKLSEDGVTEISSSTTARVKVFAIEMAYIPQGAFYAGDNATSTASLKQAAADSDPWYVDDSEDMVMNGGEFYYVSNSNTGEDATGASFTIPAAFPNGFDAFYIMKYEVSQGQYADFLNTLTAAQDTTRSIQGELNYATYRGTISGSQGSRSASRPYRACNFLKWGDLAAYADWAALRPFTELEYEKAARGTASAVANEYAWGTATIVPDVSLTISGAEDGTETITTDVSLGACLYGDNTFSGGDSGKGPLRCGIFAESDTTRITSGASYYGVMELSGSLWERPVTIGNPTGRLFTGLHGDGSLDADGNANTANWPGTDAVVSGFRGGGWRSGATNARVSDRGNAAYTGTVRSGYHGGRCARTP
jgi:formylglycine-generating enzyme required for sulfatase activity